MRPETQSSPLGVRTCFKHLKVMPWFSSCGRMTLLMLPGLLTHALKERTHHLAFLWGTRHLISPELAGKDVLILFLSILRPCPLDHSTTTHPIDDSDAILSP